MPINLPSANGAGQSADVRVSPAEPIIVYHGNARVSYLPGSEVEATLVFGKHFLITDAQSVRDLYRCLDEIFGPLAETLRAAKRAAALADRGVPA